MSGFIVGTREGSPIVLGKRQVFLFNDHESPQCPEPKMFDKKEENMGQYKTHVLSMSPMHKNHQWMRKGKFSQKSCFLLI